MQSQCPQCHTAFRVSEDQLELAGGKVRCGQCMHVFIASEHFIEEPPADSTEAPSPAADELDIPSIEVELENSELELPDAVSIDDLNPAEIDMAEIEIADIEIPSLEAIDDTTDTAPTEDEAPIEPKDDSLPEEVISDDSTESSHPDIQSHSIHAISEPMLAANETWQEDENALAEQDEPAAEQTESISDDEAVEEEQLSAPAEEEAVDEAPSEEAIPLLTDSFDTSQLYPELDVAPVAERAQYTGLYSVAVILLLSLFGLQATYALRDTLAEQPELRPMMSSFCATFDCAITLPREPEKILLTRSEVRSHSAQNGALQVKASMQNQSHFRQAYPILRLQFSDLDGHALVGRDFLPEEYLPDDVNIAAGMPINTDINLSLELLDPGSEAVSFDFNLL